MAVRPTEIKLVAQMMDPDVSEEAKALAREIIVALDDARQDREQWILGFRSHEKLPAMYTGPWSTKTQAVRAAQRVVFEQDPNTTPGVGYVVTRMMGPDWIFTI